MAKNELLPFANGEDANVLPTAQWEALTDILENGFQSGIAKSEQVNRVLAQGAVASYVLGQLIVDQLNKDATLDKDTLYQNIVQALQENAKDACLPLSGGTMAASTGINFASYPNIKVGSDGTSFFIGNNSSSGVLARFYDYDNADNPGGFQLRVSDGTTSKYFFLKADGTIQFDKQRVLRGGDIFIKAAYSATLPSGGTWAVIGHSSGEEKDGGYCATVAGGTKISMADYGGKKFIFAIRIS